MRKQEENNKLRQNLEDINPEEAKRLEKIDKERQMRPVGPTVGHRRGMMFMDEKAKLEHPRSVLWRWIFSYLFKHKLLFFFFVILIIIGTIINSITPLLTRTLIDAGIVGKNAQIILSITVLYLSLIIFMSIGNYIGSYGLGKVGQGVVFSMRNDVFKQLQKMSMSYFDKHPSGDIISRATNDVDQMNLLVGGQLVQVVTSVISLLLSLIFMFILSPFLSLFALIVFPVYYLLSRWFRNRVIGAFKETRKKISKVTSSIQENIAGAKTVQAFGQEQKATDEFDQANVENAEASFRARRIFATFFPLITFMSSVLTASVLVIGGYVNIIDIAPFGIIITVGILAAFIQYMSSFFQPFMTLTQIQQIIESAMAAADRIYAILEEEVDLPDPVYPVEIVNPKGLIEFINVSFGYKFDATQKVEKSTTIIPNVLTKSQKRSNPKEEISMQSRKASYEESLGLDPVLIMQRVQRFLSILPEPYKAFFSENLMRIPQEIRQEMMLNLKGTPPDEIPTKIDTIFAKYGYAIPGTQHSNEHPNLKIILPQASKPPIMAMIEGRAAQITDDDSNSDLLKERDKDQKPNLQSIPPFFKGILNNPEILNRMIRGLERMLKGSTRMPSGGSSSSGIGGETGGMMGSAGGRSSSMNSR
jgi:ABC-type multidrug transport system fused ATPase/permease subunit